MPDTNLCTKETLVEILDSLNIGVVYVDKEGSFSLINKAGKKLETLKAKTELVVLFWIVIPSKCKSMLRKILSLSVRVIIYPVIK